MTLILCLDDENGMMFNHRRQSRDRVLIAELLSHVDDGRLYISPYSAPLFPAEAKNVTVAENPCAAADDHAYAFVEDTDPAPHWSRVSEIILYRWNRLYPADVTFTQDMTDFHLIETSEFVGSSHDQITKEIWKR